MLEILRRFFLIGGMVVIGIIVASESIWACNCVSGLNDGVYLWATFVLLPLPFVIFGLIAWFIVRKKRKNDKAV